MTRGTLIAYAVTIFALSAAAVSLSATLKAFNIHIYKAAIYPASGLTLLSLPSEVEGFTLLYESPPLSAEIQKSLGTTNYVSRNYQETSEETGAGGDERPRVVEFHSAYYTGDIDTVPHVPERCFVGSGDFAIDGKMGQVVRIPLDLDRFTTDPGVDTSVHGVILRGRTSPYSEAPGVRVRMPRELERLRMNVTRFVDQNGGVLYAGYFFIANGGTVPRADDVRSLAFNNQATHAYYVKVQFSSRDVASADELAELAAEFLNETFPDLMRRVPDWVDVVEGDHPDVQRAAPGPGADATHD